MQIISPISPLLVVALAAAQEAATEPATPASTVAIQRLEGKLRVEVRGRLVTEYRYTGYSRPILYPLVGPGGVAVTRDWPMAETPDEARDHPHHKSVWFSHGSVNGHDFWAEGAKAGRIVHRGFDQVEVVDNVGTIVARNDWLSPAGAVVCSDVRTLRFHDRPEGVVFDHDVTLRATRGEVRLGDTKEGTMAIRMAPRLRLKGKVAAGKVRNSAGVEGRGVWGKRAAWIDYWGPLGGRTIGVAIFDHPHNHAHPTWWHARDYGLCAANPFGVHDFERKPAGAGDVVLAEGQELSLRYRFVVHEGDVEQAKIAALYREYAAAAKRTAPDK